MQAPFPEPSPTATFFSRERRRQRMMKFLEAFDRRSRRCVPELPFLLPLGREDPREPHSCPPLLHR